MIAAVERERATSGSITPLEGSNRKSPEVHSNAENTISSTSRFISESMAAFGRRPRSTSFFPKRVPDCRAISVNAQTRSSSEMRPRRFRNEPIFWVSLDDVAVRSSPFSKKSWRTSSPCERVSVPFNCSRKIRLRMCGSGASSSEPWSSGSGGAGLAGECCSKGLLDLRVAETLAAKRRRDGSSA